MYFTLNPDSTSDVVKLLKKRK
uniref:Uncharacterized protein n=1 Tax=Anguilla anguilla TaxID=7936 RepID=A0A0E9RCC3_ANGAN